MAFQILVETAAGVKGTIECPNFNYVDPLNTLRQGVLKFNSLNKVDMALLQNGSFITISRNGSQEFYGKITDSQKFSGGAIKVEFGGIEVGLAEDNGNYSNSPYTSTASATIASDIITEAPNWSNGTIEAGASIDFRIKKTASYLNALGNLIKMTGQDIQFDDSNTASLKIDILDHRGSSTSVATLNDGIEITNTGYRYGRPIGNDVRVYGKGDGDNQITSDFSTYGQDASSKSTYGTIVKPVIDKTIMSESQSNDLADILVAKYKLPTKVYTFRVIDFTLDITTGDVVIIHSDELELNEELRVTAVERGLQNNQEFMSIEVTNKEYSETQIMQNKKQIQLEKQIRENGSYMQGTTNVLTFSEMINANSSAPLRVKAYFPSEFIQDEAGNLRVNSFALDYDVDPFRSGIGSASEDNVAPGVAGTSGSTAPGVSGTSSSTAPGVSGNSGYLETLQYVGGDSISTVACSSGSWTTVAIVRPGSSYDDMDLFAEAVIMGESGGAEDIEVRIGNDSVYGYIEPGVVGSGATVWGTYCDGFRDTSMIDTGLVGVGPVNTSTDDIFVQVRPQSGAISLDCGLWLYTIRHRHDDGSYSADSHGHSDGSYAADSHGHGDGSYAAASHNHNVSIGDGISDAGATNATGVNIYLDFWNGSSWVNKHSILSTGKTIDYDVDLSNGGTYPDAPGFWQVRIYTNNATPDLCQGLIKCKHELDA